MMTDRIVGHDEVLTRGHKKKARTRQQLLDAAQRMAMALVVSATIGAMTSVVEGRISSNQHDSMITEMILLALGVPAETAKHIAYLPMSQTIEF